MSNHTSNGDSNPYAIFPKSQRSPSPVSNDRTPSTIMADNNQDDSTNRHHATMIITVTTVKNFLLVIGMQVVYIQYVQFKSSHNEACSIYTSRVPEEPLHKVVLTFLQTLHAKGHTA